ncbi:MAG: curli assembly protein CsgF [Flavobacterium sp.]|nr:curli assembly protein CsgF [Flavobacterium sp.]
MKYLIFILFFSLNTNAQDLVYKPKNPAFGGDTFNYQWLLSSADSQNKFKDPEETNGYEKQTELERFTENLNSQLLNYLSRTLFQNEFGTGYGTGTGEGQQLQDGVYTFGSLSVEIYQSNLGLVVNILDIYTGEETQVIIPGN